MEGIIGTLLPFIVIIAIFYFLLIRPQQKKAKETREMQSALSRGDKVVTYGGVKGTIESIDDKEFVLRSGNSKLTFERSAVRDVLKKSSAPHEKNGAETSEPEEKESK